VQVTYVNNRKSGKTEIADQNTKRSQAKEEGERGRTSRLLCIENVIKKETKTGKKGKKAQLQRPLEKGKKKGSKPFGKHPSLPSKLSRTYERLPTSPPTTKTKKKGRKTSDLENTDQTQYDALIKKGNRRLERS